MMANSVRVSGGRLIAGGWAVMRGGVAGRNVMTILGTEVSRRTA
jgi:hypothetical protein